MIAALVLAAGASTRLGQPKQLAILGGETLLRRAVRVAREAGLHPVIVVLGASHAEILAQTDLTDAMAVLNGEWQQGMSSSIRLGVRTLELTAKDAAGVVLMACDQPAVTPEHLNLLTASAQVKASHYGGRNGVPAYFPRQWFHQLANLTGDQGARSLLLQAPFIELPHGELDIDRPEDLACARELFG